VDGGVQGPPTRHSRAVPTTSVFLHDRSVAHRRALRSAGISNDRIRTAVRTGRWQEPVRGVVVDHGGGLTQRERWQVGLEFAGPGSCLSHHSALKLWGARADELAPSRRTAGVAGVFRAPADGGMVEVSRCHGQHMASHGFVVVHQSRRPLVPAVVTGLPVTSAARAVVDISLSARRRADVVHAVADALQRELVTVEDLVAEARALGRRLGPWLRTALDDARRGMRSVGESDLRRVVVAAGLPEPEWNAPVETPLGTFLVDALWRDRGVGAEADGRAWHLNARDWADDLRRQNALHGAGLVLLRFPVARLRTDRLACGRELAVLVG
jgi:very-short-patch-repair endonuclease